MDIYSDGLFAGVNTPEQKGIAMLTWVILRFGPTDGKHLKDILDCIKEQTPGGTYYPLITIQGNSRKSLSPDEATAHWDHYQAYYERDGWKAKYDVMIHFKPEEKRLLEDCMCSVDDTLMRFLTDILDDAWGKAPNGTILN
jgi:hypothetical protein